ncbi:hypothetical protein [Prosthecobacter fusiformis]|nr:hypothetical protein [Prosthecobacter fusiformis]
MLLPAIPQAILHGDPDMLVGILLHPWILLPVAFISLFLGAGLLTYPLCLAFAIYFIREELSYKWLLVPMALIALDTGFMGLRWRGL